MRWPEIPFSKLAEIVTGNTPPKKNPENYGPGVPWVKPPDLDNWEPVIVTAETLSPKGQKISRLLPKNTVMVSCIGSIGRVGIAGTTLATNQQINSLVFSSIIEPRFGYYYCKSITQQFQSLAAKAVVPILNKTNFSKIKMPLPSFSEQHRIVEILNQADRLRKLRADADAKAQCILPALFIKMFGDPATNSMGWKTGKLENVIDETQYGTSKKANTNGKGIIVLRMNNIDYDGHLNLANVKHVVLSEREQKKYALAEGDILFNRTNSKELVGKTGLWRSEVPAVIASYLIRVRLNNKVAIPEFVWAYMNCPFIKQVLLNKSRRAIGMANINAKELRDIPLILPGIKKQKIFAEKYVHIKRFREQRRGSNDTLNQLFNTLLYHAFTGDLTASWREAHMKELLEEMVIQAKTLAS